MNKEFFLNITESYFMDELDDFFEEKEKRLKKLKFFIKFPMLKSSYNGNIMKLKQPKKKKKVSFKIKYIPVIRKKKNIDNLF